MGTRAEVLKRLEIMTEEDKGAVGALAALADHIANVGDKLIETPVEPGMQTWKKDGVLKGMGSCLDHIMKMLHQLGAISDEEMAGYRAISRSGEEAAPAND